MEHLNWIHYVALVVFLAGAFFASTKLAIRYLHASLEQLRQDITKDMQNMMNDLEGVKHVLFDRQGVLQLMTIKQFEREQERCQSIMCRSLDDMKKMLTIMDEKREQAIARYYPQLEALPQLVKEVSRLADRLDAVRDKSAKINGLEARVDQMWSKLYGNV